MFSHHAWRNLWSESSEYSHWYSKILKTVSWNMRLLSFVKILFCIRRWYYFALWLPFFSKMNFYLPLGKWVVIHTERGQLVIILKWLPSHTRCERYTKLLACPKFPPSKFGLGCEPQSVLRSFKVALGEAAFFSILFCACCIKLWKIYFVQLLNYTLLAPISLFLFFKTFFIHLFHVCILPIPKCMLRHKFTAAFTPIFLYIYAQLPCFWHISLFWLSVPWCSNTADYSGIY